MLGGHVRFVWNQGLRHCLDKLDKGEKIPSVFDLHKLIIRWKKKWVCGFSE
ncbi:helix-turn-helix domain-containing protein [Candidatus Enterovibrio escicola]|uniref:helix-turn-helix domain-containing protein n=1 Tax=Candidatus Enterovibrio escicola TaxID=1927127 RepID=UPI003743F0FC